MNDESAHVSFFKAALKEAGATPRPTPTFKRLAQSSQMEFVTIEARHAGFVSALLGAPLSENGAFDKPISHAEVITAVSPFIESVNGGPDPQVR
jgi:hypothetical protein